MITTLAIGDPHAEPNNDNVRFEALGNFIAERQPDNIVQMGDFLSLDSLSLHDEDKPLIKEGRRLKDDIEAGIDAYIKMMGPTKDLQDWQREKKKKIYSPDGTWILGNHEDRALRLVQRMPELEGYIDHRSLLNVAADGWDIVDYRKYRYIEGVAFTHVPMNPKNNQPISGKYVSARAAEIHDSPIVFAHTHLLQTHTIARHSDNPEGNQVRALNVGWFGDFKPGYVGDNTLDWWGGIVLLHHYDKGKFDIETISMDRFKREYL